MKTIELILSILLKGKPDEQDKVLAAEIAARPKTSTEKLVLRLILQRKPTKRLLLDVVGHVAELGDLAASMLLERDLTKDELCHILLHVPSRRREAWVKFLDCKPTPDDLNWIFQMVPEYRDDAWELIKKSPSNEQLIMAITTPKFKEAWETLSTRSLSEAELRKIWLYVNRNQDLYLEVGNRLVDLGASDDNLFSVIQNVWWQTGELTKAELEMTDRAIDIIMARAPKMVRMINILPFAKLEVRETICKACMKEDSSIGMHVLNVRYTEKLKPASAKFLLRKQDYEYPSQLQQAMEIVLIKYPPLRRKAWKRFLSSDPTPGRLRELYSFAKHEEADEEVVRMIAEKWYGIIHYRSDDRSFFADRSALLHEYPDLKDKYPGRFV